MSLHQLEMKIFLTHCCTTPPVCQKKRTCVIPGISNYKPVTTELRLPGPVQRTHSICNICLYDRGNYNPMSAELHAFLPNSHNFSKNANIRSLWSALKNRIDELIGKCYSSKIIRGEKKLNKDCVNKNVLQLTKHRKRAYTNYCEHKCGSNRHKLKTLTDEYKNHLDTAKETYFNMLSLNIYQNNYKGLWKSLKSNNKHDTQYPLQFKILL